MGRRIYIIGLGYKENTQHSEALVGLLQPPYSESQFLLVRDQVWASCTEEGVEEFGSLEIEEVLAIETTNASNVFMERFHENFPNFEDNGIISDSEGSYWLTQENMIPFLEHLVSICQVFHEKEFKVGLFGEEQIEIEASEQVALEELVEKEWEKRENDPEGYEKKWGADYFNFSLLGKTIFKGLIKAENYPFFIVFDA